MFPGGACLAGSDDPAKYGNYQQTQKQSKPTHATKVEYSNVVPRSMEIIHFGAEIFRYVCMHEWELPYSIEGVFPPNFKWESS